jgi:hypothetical protein
MTTRLIVLTDVSKHSTQNTITEAIKAAGADWWHWFPMCWLVLDSKERDHSWWLDYLSAATKSADPSLFLMTAPYGGWSIYSVPEAMPWLDEKWSPDPPKPATQS